MERDYIEINKEKIYYSLYRKNIKNINLKVNIDKQIIISAPIEANEECIKEVLKKKIKWIKKQQEFYDTYSEIKENINFENGETVFLLGNQYLMNIEPSDQNSIELKGKYLKLYIKREYINKKEYINKLYEQWLKEYSINSFKNIIEYYEEKMKHHNVNKPQIIIRKMSKRWGSCLPKENKVLLNLKLVKTPVCCIEYVILHEFCHFTYSNHSKKFYDFLNVFMPDWKERKKILDEEYVGII